MIVILLLYYYKTFHCTVTVSQRVSSTDHSCKLMLKEVTFWFLIPKKIKLFFSQIVVPKFLNGDSQCSNNNYC